jgi:hypothetical protein
MPRIPLIKFELSDPPPVADAAQVAVWVSEQLRVVQGWLNAISDGFLEETFVEPNKLFTGLIRFADGTQWDPGSGRGIYYYDESVPGWVKL